jgi:mannose-6-phosphate isomerase-like protein (cupin superfamily)
VHFRGDAVVSPGSSLAFSLEEPFMISGVVFSIVLAFAQAAGTDPTGFVIWPHGLPPTGTPQKLQFGTHGWSLAHREKSGEVESHETRSIVMVVQSGEATLVIGNDVVDPTRPTPTELRGTSIRNGIERKVTAGDVINMPAGLPHQFLLEPGKQITYIDIVVPSAATKP